MQTNALRVDTADAETLVAAEPWWYHKFEIAPGVITPGVYDIAAAIKNMQLPADMSAMTVLEIGPADGAFTKAMWERGAAVTVVDYERYPKFELMQKLSGCTATYLTGNVLDLPRLELGKFDVVVMMGVLYHLPDPFRALWLLRQHLKPDSRLILETLIIQREGPPMMEYLPKNSSNHDYTNFWRPNVQCCIAMLEDCGLTVDSHTVGDTRAIFHARVNPAPKSAMKAARGYSVAY